MEFHTRQSIQYGGAELCDSCEDSAPGAIARHPTYVKSLYVISTLGEVTVCEVYSM